MIQSPTSEKINKEKDHWNMYEWLFAYIYCESMIPLSCQVKQSWTTTVNDLSWMT